MTPLVLIETVRISRPVYALTVLLQSVTQSSGDFVIALTRAGIKAQNFGTTRSVFCAPYDEEQDTSAFADTDICCSFLAYLAEKPELVNEYFESDSRMILDYHVLHGTLGDYHIGCEFRGNSLVIRRIPRLNPEDLPNYRFIKVVLVG